MGMAAKKLEIPSLELLESALKREEIRKTRRRILRNIAFALLVAAAMAVLVVVLLLPVLQVNGSSMQETLQNEDIVVAVNSPVYHAGDVVAFYYNNSILIKRVIADAGDWVDIDREGNVYVNDRLLDEPYIHGKSLGRCNIELPYRVPDGKCFVMGDHRAVSVDSRNTAVGCVDNDKIMGRVLFRIWPLSGLGRIK